MSTNGMWVNSRTIFLYHFVDHRKKKVNNKPFIRYHYLRLILAIFFSFEFFDSLVSMHRIFVQYFKSDALKKQSVINEWLGDTIYWIGCPKNPAHEN